MRPAVYMIQARNFMSRLHWDYPDMSATQIAEDTANHLNHAEWLENETHWIWELAIEYSKD